MRIREHLLLFVPMHGGGLEIFMAKGVCAVSISPAIDRSVYVDDFKLDNVNRVNEGFDSPGSKGVNVALNLAVCGLKSTCTGFIGGHGSNFITSALKNGNVICDFVPVDYDVRINYKIVDLKNKTYTDINYPCGVPSDESISVFKTKLKALAQQNEYVALSGNISPVLSSLYSELCSIITSQGAKVTIDCSKHALFLAAKQKPYAIKPNLNELNEAFNLNCTTKDDIKNAALRLCESGIKNVLVSLDKDGAIAVCDKKAYFVSVCDVPVLNTVGAGDAFLSGFIYSKMSGFDDSLCLKYAASFAQANVSHRACDKKSFDDFKKYVSQIRVEEF